MTEKTIEGLLQQDVRVLVLPDGRRHAHRAFRIFWMTVDELSAPPLSLPLPKLIQDALDIAAACGRSFEHCFNLYIPSVYDTIAPPWRPRYLPRPSSGSRSPKSRSS